MSARASASSASNSGSLRSITTRCSRGLPAFGRPGFRFFMIIFLLVGEEGFEPTTPFSNVKVLYQIELLPGWYLSLGQGRRI